MDIAISIAVTFLLTLVNGFFSMSEMALSTAKKVVLEHEAEEGDLKAKQAAEVSGDSGEFLAAIQVAITLVGFFSSAFAATNLSEPLAKVLVSMGVPAHGAGTLSTVLITLIVSYSFYKADTGVEKVTTIDAGHVKPDANDLTTLIQHEEANYTVRIFSNNHFVTVTVK